jgi:Rha family phage regulatory protein
MSEMIELTVINGTPTTTSLVVSEHFGKRHDNVLRDIERLECSKKFLALNFEEVTYRYVNGKGGVQTGPAYNITKDGFMFLAMGFTGKEAAEWKVRFIEAFNAMESELLRVAAQAQFPKPDGTLFLSHAADIMVAADRTFRSVLRSSRAMGIKLPAALRRAHEVTLHKTGVNMLDELQAHDHLAALETPAKANAADDGGLREFWAAYDGGGLPGGACLPLPSILLHKLYAHWCRQQARQPLALPVWAHALGRSGVVRSARKRYKTTAGVTVGPAVFLFPTGDNRAPDDLAESVWLGQCVEQIQFALQEASI